MPPEALGGAMHDQVGTELDRTLVDRRGEGVVDHGDRIGIVRRLDQPLEVEPLEVGVGGRLQMEQPAALCHLPPESRPESPRGPSCCSRSFSRIPPPSPARRFQQAHGVALLTDERFCLVATSATERNTTEPCSRKSGPAGCRSSHHRSIRGKRVFQFVNQ
jgi:hypothetical protein